MTIQSGTTSHKRGMFFYSFILIAFILVGGVSVITLIMVQDLRDQIAGDAQVITIDSPSVIAENSNVCPDDVLVWVTRFTYHQAPLLVEMVRNVKNLDKDLFVDYLQRATIPIDRTGTDDSKTQWVVPMLDPGRYRLIVSATDVLTVVTSDRRLLQYAVDFTVKNDCTTEESP